LPHWPPGWTYTSACSTALAMCLANIDFRCIAAELGSIPNDWCWLLTEMDQIH
jgi:hypothetical protein